MGLYTLGVAAGDPTHSSIALWTRLCPEPFKIDSGMGKKDIPGKWRIATDRAMKNVIRSGTATARATMAFSVHATVTNLPARATGYWYDFIFQNTRSTPAHLTLLPPAASSPALIKFIVAGCQAFDAGHYSAWKQIAAESPDFIYNYGDFIYPPQSADARSVPASIPRSPAGLMDFRRMYATVLRDRNLQAARAATSWINTWDDHEFENSASVDTADALKAAAIQAWYEHMPLRRSYVAGRSSLQIYGRYRFGDLMDFVALDSRLYRSANPGDGSAFINSVDMDDEDRTMLGATQEAWLEGEIENSDRTWFVFGNQVPFGQQDWSAFANRAGESPLYRGDGWDGVSAARRRLIDAIVAKEGLNPVFVSGDVHKGMALDIKDGVDVVSSELIGTSITSGGDGTNPYTREAAIKAQNAHVKYVTDERGYLRCTVTPETFTADFRAVPYVEADANAAVATRKTYFIEAGTPGLQTEA